MTYTETGRNQSHYDADNGDYNTGGRDQYDKNMYERQRGFSERHEDQIKKAVIAEENDGDWVLYKNQVEKLNDNIRIRQSNYDTYMNALKVEKQLFNREQTRTIILGTANVVTLAGAIYMWSS